jgi:hypothetical protein
MGPEDKEKFFYGTFGCRNLPWGWAVRGGQVYYSNSSVSALLGWKWE